MYVEQKVEMLEVFTGFETENRYAIYLTGPDCQRGATQMPYFYAVEKSECCHRNCCGSDRGFEMDIIGPDGGVAMHLDRPFKCSSCGCGCCLLPEMSIQDGMGNLVGSVQNRFECCGDLFDILDQSGIPVLTIHGECCQIGKFCPCSE